MVNIDPKLNGINGKTPLTVDSSQVIDENGNEVDLGETEIYEITNQEGFWSDIKKWLNRYFKNLGELYVEGYGHTGPDNNRGGAQLMALHRTITEQE